MARTRLLCLIALICLCGGAVASAAVIDFENGSGPLPYAEYGYHLTNSGSFAAIYSPLYFVNGNGTNILGWCTDCGAVQTLTLTDGGQAFSLYSLDAAFFLAGDREGTQSLSVTGYYPLGGTITETFGISYTWSTYELTGFSGVSSVEIQNLYSDTYAAIDNLAVSGGAVPEPATWLLFSAGLAALGFFRRARRS